MERKEEERGVEMEIHLTKQCGNPSGSLTEEEEEGHRSRNPRIWKSEERESGEG